MLRFNGIAKLRFEYKDSDGIKWFTLKNDLILSDDDKVVVKVPKDLFSFDCASVPKYLQWIYSPQGRYTRSAIIHDFNYSKPSVNRFYADKLFLKCMKLDGVKFHTRWLFYGAVLIFGSSSKA